MKIAVSAHSRDPADQVDPRFGRASCFLIYDTAVGDYQVCDNTQNLNARQGAGIQAAQAVLGQGVQAVLTGHCGPKAFQVLAAASIDVYVGVTGPVQEAVDRLLAGDLQATSQPDVQGHW